MTAFKTNELVYITIFDDDNQSLSNGPNEWRIIGPSATHRTVFGPGKYKIQHRTSNTTLDISTWKLKRINHQPNDDSVDDDEISSTTTSASTQRTRRPVPSGRPRTVTPSQATNLRRQSIFNRTTVCGPTDEVATNTHCQPKKVRFQIPEAPHTGGAAGTNHQTPAVMTEGTTYTVPDPNDKDSHRTQHATEANAIAWAEHATQAKHDAVAARTNAEAWNQYATEAIGTTHAQFAASEAVTAKANADAWARYADQANDTAWGLYKDVRRQQMREHLLAEQVELRHQQEQFQVAADRLLAMKVAASEKQPATDQVQHEDIHHRQMRGRLLAGQTELQHRQQQIQVTMDHLLAEEITASEKQPTTRQSYDC